MNRNEIQIRDPFIFPDTAAKTYYLFGTTDPDPWKSPGLGFDVYFSGDLEHWTGPVQVYSPDSEFWGTHNFWAPEIHLYRGTYYMFASFTAYNRCRGTHILSSEHITGPYSPVSGEPATPRNWECLDGTLYCDEKESPWIVFCHEWVQVHKGTICAQRLTQDLTSVRGEPIVLFDASSAKWTRALQRRDGSGIGDAGVTDGPFIRRLENGVLMMLWSSIAEGGYAMGTAFSESGKITGPWIQSEVPLISCDGGHGMVFRGFEGALYLTYHSPNDTPNERFHYVPVRETGTGLALV